LEILVGVTGLAIVVRFPDLTQPFARLLHAGSSSPLHLNALRLGLAFALLLVPTTAMGATLPVMVKALHAWNPEFGRVLGRLYGWNTIGAMAGAVLVEELLIGALGLRGSAVVALGLNVVAAVVAVALHRRATAPAACEPAPAQTPAPARRDLRRLVCCAFLLGAALLGLEVVWFRFLQLFALSTTRSFAMMLVAVLLGIGGGGLASSLWLKYRADAHRFSPVLALAAGVMVVFTYARFDGLPAWHRGSLVSDVSDTLSLSVHLMFPVAFLSGILFTLVGRAAFERCGEVTQAVGRVALWNTLGAMSGALVTGLALLPAAGVEGSLFFLSMAYPLAAVLFPARWSDDSSPRRLTIALGVAYAAALAVFPFGLMRDRFVPTVAAVYSGPTTRIVGYREGLTETLTYTEDLWHGAPVERRLISNAVSYARTNVPGLRYMKYFVYWPLAFHPQVRKALLVCYGLGVTAKALTDSAEIEQIDVVDISRDVLESPAIYRDPRAHPLADPRVRVHVDDGRFYLLTTKERYDLITGEPPPPNVAGVVNLYSREYFQLVRERLNEGGIVTYWLPVRTMNLADTKSILSAFCGVFPDCSLWRASGLELMLVGSRNAGGPIDESRFRRQWEDPRTRPQLEMLGFETPELLLTTFVGGSDFLSGLVGSSEPLEDDFPYRMSRRPRPLAHHPTYYRILEPGAALQRYLESGFLKERLPRHLHQAAAPYYAVQATVDRVLEVNPRWGHINPEELDGILATGLRTPVLWILGDFLEPSGAVEALASRNPAHPDVAFMRGVRAFADRRYLEAEEQLRNAEALEGGNRFGRLRVLALAYAGRVREAEDLAAKILPRTRSQGEDLAFWDFCVKRFGLQLRADPL